MTKRPTLDAAEQAILSIFKDHGTRPDGHIMSITLSPLMSGEGRFTADELNAALQSMHKKEWVDISMLNRATIKLLEPGFEQI